jgi:hypothetical protein
MASPNESNQESRDKHPPSSSESTRSNDRRSTDLESAEQHYEPFSNEDPYGASRITALRGETSTLLDEIQAEATHFERTNHKQLQHLHEDAIERSKWSETRQDGFISILRLGKSTPPRANRVL